MTEIKLEVGQTWVDIDGNKRTIEYINHNKICYLNHKGKEMYMDSEYVFRAVCAHKLAPKTVRKSMALAAYKYPFRLHNLGYYATKEEAEDQAVTDGIDLVMWPLVVNGVEQWVEIPTE